MKKTLLFTALLASSIGFSQNLLLNGTGDEYTSKTSDNADAFDMTPPSTIIDNSGAEVDNPFVALWNNSDLDAYIETTYVTSTVDRTSDEQPGSTSDGTYDGATKTRGYKLYDDADSNPAISASTRRMYQKVAVTAGQAYVFSMDSRSEAENINSEVFILNEEITTEVGLENGDADSRVDGYLEITNDFNSSKGGEGDNTFTNNELSFTASGDFVVVYIRSLSSVDKDTEVFIDNLVLEADATASSDDFLASSFSVYPNPASGIVTVASELELSSVSVYNTLGKLVSSSSETSFDVSGLAKGVYFVKVTAEGATATKKLIVE